MDERRQLPRWEIKQEAKVWLPQMQEFRLCIVEDMNLKGMCVSFDKQLPQERLLNISLGLEDNSEPMKLEVNLPWTKEDQGRHVYGMVFNKIGEMDKDRIDQYINAHCSQQLKDKWWDNV